LLGSIVFAILTYLVSQRFCYVKHNWVRAAKASIVFLLVYMIPIALKTSVQGWLFWGMRVLALPLSLLLLLAWHFFERDEIEVVKRRLTLLNEQTKLLGRCR